MNLIIIPNLIKLISKSGMNQIKLGMMMNGMGLTRRERGEQPSGREMSSISGLNPIGSFASTQKKMPTPLRANQE